MSLFDWLGYGVTHGYITQSGCSDCPHYAVDIGTPFHTPITALFPGTVVSQRTGLSYGTEVFIRPDDPNLPQYYYYHLDTLATTPGEHLNAGDLVGLSGGQNSGGSNPSSPTMSSGPHTHVGFFTNYQNGRPYGPDISPFITALAKGASIANIQVPGGQQNSSSSTSCNAWDISCILTSLRGGIVKSGIFLVGMVLFLIGIVMLAKPQKLLEKAIP